jgi:hypothetical protein
MHDRPHSAAGAQSRDTEGRADGVEHTQARSTAIAKAARHRPPIPVCEPLRRRGNRGREVGAREALMEILLCLLVSPAA